MNEESDETDKAKNDAPESLIELRGLRKSYNIGRPNEAEVLHGLDLSVARGEFAALIGPTPTRCGTSCTSWPRASTVPLTSAPPRTCGHRSRGCRKPATATTRCAWPRPSTAFPPTLANAAPLAATP